jgi:hypothetical protein
MSLSHKLKGWLALLGAFGSAVAGLAGIVSPTVAAIGSAVAAVVQALTDPVVRFNVMERASDPRDGF